MEIDPKLIMTPEARILGAAVKVAYADCADDTERASQVSGLSVYVWQRYGAHVIEVAKSIRVAA